ncbi:HesA/MoeB/ThiF family protein [Metabacillus sp. Hm71]|uniref:HesA/MoeB/ThiF family protein n=1 Tax=Metabacillus sp. Hm71 TaxID=3450743 RepID=UPI003F43BA53
MPQKPMMKPIHLYYKKKEATVRLGMMEDAIDLEDPNGAIYRLMTLMDGSRTFNQLYQELIVDYPEIHFFEMVEAIEELNSMGYLIDASYKDKTSLTAVEQERFKGNLNYYSYYANLSKSPYDIQEQVKNAKVTIIGMGAFGCSLLFNLAGLGVKKVKLIDYDTVELSNLNRQMLFNEKSIGQSKIEEAKNFMSSFYSAMEIETVSTMISHSKMVEDLIQGSDLVLLAADQPPFLLPHWVNKACVKLNIPFIAGRLNISSADIYTILPGKTGCVDCNFIHLHREDNEEDHEEFKIIANFVPPNWATAPNLMMITGMISHEAKVLLAGLGEPSSSGKILHLDFRTFKSEVRFEWQRLSDECPTCGHGHSDMFKILEDVKFQNWSMVKR